jgi:hypothetical protein
LAQNLGPIWDMAQALHLVEESAIEQLKALQEETRFSYEHLTLMLSKIRK